MRITSFVTEFGQENDRWRDDLCEEFFCTDCLCLLELHPEIPLRRHTKIHEKRLLWINPFSCLDNWNNVQISAYVRVVYTTMFTSKNIEQARSLPVYRHVWNVNCIILTRILCLNFLYPNQRACCCKEHKTSQKWIFYHDSCKMYFAWPYGSNKLRSIKESLTRLTGSPNLNILILRGLLFVRCHAPYNLLRSRNSLLNRF